jgi:hypothetical protein
LKHCYLWPAERKILMSLEKELIITALEVWHQNCRRRLYKISPIHIKDGQVV